MVYLTPDSDRWDPQATHYADAEAAMVDNCGEVVDRERIKTTIFEAADISEMYAEPCTWDVYDDTVDAIMQHDATQYFGELLLNDDNETRLNHDGIRAQLAGLSSVNKPSFFLASTSDCATISHLCMALGSTTVDDAVCTVFESRAYGELLALADVSAIATGWSQGVTPEHISKIRRIPFDDAVTTLEETTQLIKQSPDSSLSRNANTNDRAV